MKKHTVIDETGGVVWVELKQVKNWMIGTGLRGSAEGIRRRKIGERTEIASKRGVG